MLNYKLFYLFIFFFTSFQKKKKKMAYFQNSETNEIYSLMPNEQVILGRDKYGLKGRYCSREHGTKTHRLCMY